MFTRFTKTTSNVFSQTLRHTLRSHTKSFRPFTSLQNTSSSEEQPAIESKELTTFLTNNDAHINEYMRKLYKYMAGAAVVGISAAQILSATVPLGFPSALLILTGFGLEHLGAEHINKTRPGIFKYIGQDGNIQYGNKNPALRKLAFASSCLGYGCIIASIMGMIPVASSVLPLTFVTCLFSTIGHITYCKFAPKPHFDSKHLFISGLLTGALGLNLVTSGSAMFMLGSSLQLENVEYAGYLGLLMFNAFTANDSQKAMEDVAMGKGDYLKHGNKLTENWLYTLAPQFLMGMY